MDDVIPELIELAIDKALEYIQIDNLPLAPGRVKLRLKNFFRGWHVTISAAVFLATAVLITNIALLIWASCRNLTPGSGDILEISRGNCSHMQTVFTWTHVGINILSTLLLAASNSSCQVLSAPTRKEIDRAHEQGIWLDVGVPSFRNLRHIAIKRVIVYFLLALSSIPLHLIYNSVIFPTTSTEENFVALVEERFVHGAAWNATGTGALAWIGNKTDVANTVAQLQRDAHDHTLERMDSSTCVQQLSNQFISQYSSFLLVTKSYANVTNFTTNSLLQSAIKSRPTFGYSGGYNSEGLSWLCMIGEFECDFPKLYKNPEAPFEIRYRHLGHRSSPVQVSYCLAQPISPHCSVSMSRGLLVAVIVCNFFKLVCFLLIVKWADDRPLVTVGDAISSFLRRPDPSTRNLGPLSAMDVRNKEWGGKDSLKMHNNLRPWKPAFWRYWFVAAGWRRWAVALSCYLIFYVPSLVLPWLSSSTNGFGTIGNFGNINPNQVLIFTEDWSLTANVLFVNLPQLIISFCYLFCNAVITGSLLASEYNDFGRHRKGLRVTDGAESQRETYWLQIPYRYAIPIMVLFTALHWLVSQSIFLARVTFYASYWHHNGQNGFIDGCGWSPIPVLMFVILGGIILVAFIAMGFREYPANVPIVGTCTAAMAAACHASDVEGIDMDKKPLMYGVLKSSSDDKIRRVGFSSEEVDTLVFGEIYR